MNFMLRGVIQIATEGKSIALVSLTQSWTTSVFSGVAFGVPAQMFWALAFVAYSSLLFNCNRFGAHVKIVGDNPDSARQMEIDVNAVRVKAFMYVGLGAALAGFFSTMINFTWWPTSGDGYLLPALTSVFVGGTPTWGGVGTVAGGAIGSLIVSLIQTRNRRRGPERVLRPILLRFDHHPLADRPSMEPDPVPVNAAPTIRVLVAAASSTTAPATRRPPFVSPPGCLLTDVRHSPKGKSRNTGE